MGRRGSAAVFLSVFYQISSLTASDWPRFFKIGFNRQVEEGSWGIGPCDGGRWSRYG